ncbi:Stp1/IreP family PP2C-type Ser/Thr phosphatase [Dellaglioa sp. P0083]|uniref:Stp1/IreP family PP2C-type Ser/Thr phosphatase n=1 Tax=Dellaglioa kimchii TaxID=3344667 RepID=UPI0038D36CD0
MKVAYQTDVGSVRENNEDYVGVFHNKSGIFFVMVADGIGGHLGGDVASEMAVSHMGFRFEGANFSEPSDAIKWITKEVEMENKQIIEKSNQYEDLSGMGTTMVCAIFFEEKFIVANIGDSRGYLLRHKELYQLTEDHSVVNELIKRGELTVEDAKNYPQKNMITRSLGISSDADADIAVNDSESGDLLLLCTDGLTNMVSDDEIKAVLKNSETVEEKGAELIRLANKAGGLDNITILLVSNDRGIGK